MASDGDPKCGSKIIRDAASEYDGPIVISEDAMRVSVEGRGSQTSTVPLRTLLGAAGLTTN